MRPRVSTVHPEVVLDVFDSQLREVQLEQFAQMPLSRFPRRRMVEMERSRSIDLDTPLDWLVAEAVVAQMAK